MSGTELAPHLEGLGLVSPPLLSLIFQSLLSLLLQLSLDFHCSGHRLTCIICLRLPKVQDLSLWAHDHLCQCVTCNVPGCLCLWSQFVTDWAVLSYHPPPAADSPGHAAAARPGQARYSRLGLAQKNLSPATRSLHQDQYQLASIIVIVITSRITLSAIIFSNNFSRGRIFSDCPSADWDTQDSHLSAWSEVWAGQLGLGHWGHGAGADHEKLSHYI